jgi:hypothetical protein
VHANLRGIRLARHHLRLDAGREQHGQGSKKTDRDFHE